MSYSTGTDGRILSITLSDYKLPEEVTAKDHAHEIAAFAIGRTQKSEEIDRVEVIFQTPAGGLEAFSFELDDLLSAPPIPRNPPTRPETAPLRTRN